MTRKRDFYEGMIVGCLAFLLIRIVGDLTNPWLMSVLTEHHDTVSTIIRITLAVWIVVGLAGLTYLRRRRNREPVTIHLRDAPERGDDMEKWMLRNIDNLRRHRRLPPDEPTSPTS